MTSRTRIFSELIIASVAALGIPAQCRAADSDRNQVRILCGFEGKAELEQVQTSAQNMNLSFSGTNGVTEGRSCLRIEVPAGTNEGSFLLGREKIGDWTDFDFLGIDVYTEDEHSYRVNVSLDDPDTHDETTRGVFDRYPTHPGHQTLFYPISRVARSGRSWTDWEDLGSEDRLKMDKLTKVRVYIKPREDRNAVLFIDNIRLLQKEAIKPPFKVPLPEGALAFDFNGGGVAASGFKAVSPGSVYSRETGCGFVPGGGKLGSGDQPWPDLLTGTHIMACGQQIMKFQADVKNGSYLMWLSAGKVMQNEMKEPHFLLTVNEKVLCDESPGAERFNSEAYLYRFLQTQYSEKPHALWSNYVSKMYPAQASQIEVKDGKVILSAMNHFVGGLVLVPADQKAAFDDLCATIDQTRMGTFENSFYTPRQARPQKRAGDGDLVVYCPDVSARILPWTAPDDEERKCAGIQTAGAPGERVVMRVAVMPFADLGKCTLALSDLLNGPARIPAANIRGYFQNYRSDGAAVGEMALIPTLSIDIEQGVTQCYWLWMQIPERTAAGIYRGAFKLQTGKGPAVEIPVECEVYPFAIEPVLPLSLGMYYSENPHLPKDRRRKLLKEQLEFMRELGMTAVYLDSPRFKSRDGDKAEMEFDPTLHELAKEVGMGGHPQQWSLSGTLSIGRGIGRTLPGSGGNLQELHPGIELRQPEFTNCYLNAMTQYREMIRKTGLPIAVEVVDEPREIPNPWNRTLADTVLYADLLRKVGGLTTFCTPMGDNNNWMGETPVRDYTTLIDHCDIISTHGWEHSVRMVKETPKRGKTLWIFNNGMGRLSWGFYNWRINSKGRWEWHFCWSGAGSKGSYPGNEWYNPFTGSHGYTSSAPYAKYPGAILFQSCFFTAAEGIRDQAYLYTLTEAVRAKRAAGEKAEAVRKATAFLVELEKRVPDDPSLWKGSYGLPAEKSDTVPPNTWRRMIAQCLKDLK